MPCVTSLVPCRCSQPGLRAAPLPRAPVGAGTHGSWCPGAACSTRSQRSQPCRQHRRSAASSGAAAARWWPDLPREEVRDTLGGDGPALMASCTLPTSWGHARPPALSRIPGQPFPSFVPERRGRVMENRSRLTHRLPLWLKSASSKH